MAKFRKKISGEEKGKLAVFLNFTVTFKERKLDDLQMEGDFFRLPFFST
jgi:hypothetical protein